MNNMCIKMSNDIPSILLFVVGDDCFCYDAYSNRLFNVSKGHFNELKAIQKMGLNQYINKGKDSPLYNDIISMLKHGIFRPIVINNIKNEEIDYIKYITERCVSEITLQVTKSCNFMCRYCSFSIDNHMGRTHTDAKMTWETAKCAIDYLSHHSADCNSVLVSFYGGEPLLAFPLIKKVVQYAETIFYTKPISYIMTTNGFLLNNDEIIDFIANNNFKLTISFDGPKSIQDFHRKKRNNGMGTFKVVRNNIIKLRNRHPLFFSKSVNFISVLFGDENPIETIEYYKSLGINEDKVKVVYADLSGVDYKLSSYRITSLENSQIVNRNLPEEQIKYNRFKEILKDNTLFPSVWQHNGPCIPTFERLFVTTSGDFYVCERFQETPNSSIGCLQSGLDYSKIIQFMNVGKLSEAQCQTCWAKRFCNICELFCYDIEKDSLSADRKYISCNSIKAETLELLKSFVKEGKN